MTGSTPPPLTERLVELACRAPSVHNTQPWRWRIAGPTGASVELWADRDRQLRVADPEGRNLVISCGAALHHLVVAGQALDVTPDIELLPSPEQPDLLARVDLVGKPPPQDEAAPGAEMLDVIGQRCTDRRRFTTWPVPEARLNHLAQAAAGWGVHALPILDATARFHTERLVDRAQSVQAADPRYVREQEAWTDHSTADGVPSPNAVPPSPAQAGERPNRFAPEHQSAETGALVEASDGLLALCTSTDDARAWLGTGQALSAMWLRATREGLSVVPLSQVVEVEETRRSLHHDVFDDLAHPQILLRVGWQESSRTPLPATPRRPLHDVLRS